MSLIQQWANNVGALEPVNGSWLQAIAEIYSIGKSVDYIYDISMSFTNNVYSLNYYHDIAIKISSDKNIQPLNGSWLARIVELTSRS